MAGQKTKARVKRREVESGDGWTVITHGLSNLKVRGDEKENGKGNAKGGKKSVAGQVPNSTVKDLTAEKLLAEFEILQERWKGCPVARQMQELFKKREKVVKTAVCIGIGSFARDWEQRWRSLWQLVAFVHVVRLLSDDNGITTYAQDPAFTTLDMDFLKLLDITTVQTGIEKHISTESFVFSPFVDWFLLLPMFLKEKDPAVYVGNEILDDYTTYAQTAEKQAKLDECNNIGATFLLGREKQKLVDFEGHAHALNGMVVYLKEDEDGEGD
ncbi:hypothetical protein HBH56_001480 [Parastagonospora nodorum]|uniref:SRR1-like domain-containing protein n=2 Tax=Phaeosphaeria nodorum (strain SN15 / ATCC MYA-4574 / FGSC 10173) TaxID=321614 RepID=A0A7U2ENJ9_PHANO|nr:hypothetical protein SNOG_09541 [Parastagonospora nodorum SN15]KAH3920215.1 hypothetical protein HBH56_001480 [Parastagonospora nodorum]EAT82806.2 hypothetical protein SNOG_09541 [Parastagonospora nodorum SN15]KAH3937890.1 hypothetical protein HBH54_001490 [Parastagonospora nodorum]KAH3958498.1 hypothetical protein HBH51_209320 [Parastagonospora nodorum]KAH3978406.1 hypothetical protein HBH52_108650 [Parastagonospora nodorum]